MTAPGDARAGQTAPEPRLYGQIYTRLAPDALASALVGQGVTAEARESSLMWGGRYVSIPDHDAVFSLERIEDDEYIAHGDADQTDALAAVATRVSEALTRLGLRHRFEVVEDRERLATYLHHEWPLTDPPTAA